MDKKLHDRIVSELSLEAARLALAIDPKGRHLKDIAQYTKLVIETVGSYYRREGA